MTAEKTEATQMINLTIDGQAISVPQGTTVYHAAKALKIELPIFCYHESMPPFGACRVCLVEVEKMPKLQTSCTLQATEGMVVKTQSGGAVKGREEILEFLLINHPLDCPICDRGGECPLQDQTMKFGPGKSRFYEEKRHFSKAHPLGPVLMLDRERCIICARCIRFSDIVAGDSALEFKERGYRTEVGTPGDEPADSKFIGNTIMLCPVGALTSDVYRFRARPWDNDATKSTCTLCPVGCSMFLDARDGEIMRVRAQRNPDLNDIWLCDKGWFGYEFSSHKDRLQHALIKRNGKFEKATLSEALSLIAAKMNEYKDHGKMAGFGGNNLTVEESYLFQKFMRDQMGIKNLDHRIGMPILTKEEEGLQSGMEMPIGDCENLSFAILFGLNLTEEFPVIWLRLKQAINKGAKVYFIGHFKPEIAQHLSDVIVHQPGNEVEEINKFFSSFSLVEGKGALFVGDQYLNNPNRLAILQELLKAKESLSNTSLNLMEGKENSKGAYFAGMRPESGPFGESLKNKGKNAIEVLNEAAQQGWDFLYVAGANPALKIPKQLWKKAREGIKFLVVQDIFLNETAQDADVVLPTLSYVEKRGSFINIEGRVQKLNPGKGILIDEENNKDNNNASLPSFSINTRFGQQIPNATLSDGDLFVYLSQKLGYKLSIDQAFLDALKVEFLNRNEQRILHHSSQNQQRFARGENKLLASFSSVLFDHGVRMKHDSHLVQLAKIPRVRIHSNECKKLKLESGTIVRLSCNGHSIQATLKADDGVAEGTIVLLLGFSEVPVYEFGPSLMNGMQIEIQREENL